MSDHAISRLIAKRAELARIVTELEQDLDQYRADLVHIDGALRVLRADLDPETIPPRRRHLGRNILGAMNYLGSVWTRCGSPAASRRPPKKLRSAL